MPQPLRLCNLFFQLFFTIGVGGAETLGETRFFRFGFRPFSRAAAAFFALLVDPALLWRSRRAAA
jgi:hypothetical protein